MHQRISGCLVGWHEQHYRLVQTIAPEKNYRQIIAPGCVPPWIIAPPDNYRLNDISLDYCPQG